MAKTSTQDSANDNAENLFALFSVSLSVLLFALTAIAMHRTQDEPYDLQYALVILALSGTVFWIVLVTLLKLQSDLDDHQEPPSQVAQQLALTSAKYMRVPAAVFAFGYVCRPDPLWGWIVGATLALVAPWGVRLFCRSSGPAVLKGTVLMTFAEAKRQAAKLVRHSQASVNWAGIHVPLQFAAQHFCLVGATGAGKTVALRLLMASALMAIAPASDCRALVYDAKGDMMELLSGMPLSGDIHILNPFDARSVAWDIAADVTTPATALQISSIIIEDEKGHNSFFVKAARDLFANVMIALHETRPGNWTLADVVSVLSNTDRTRELLESVPLTRYVSQEHFNRDERTLANVQYTISANIAYLRPIAGLMHRAQRRFSLHEWINGSSILVLGNMEDLRCPLDAINRALFQRIVELVLSQSESSTRNTWFFLDELKEMGRLDALPRLLTKGRSKGVKAVLAFQTIEGLREVYGDRLAHEIAGMPANKALLRTDSEETASWTSRVIGEAEYRQWTRSRQYTDKGLSESVSEQIIRKPVVMPSEFMRLPLANRRRFFGYYVTPCIGTYYGPVHFARYLYPKGTAPNFLPRPEADQHLPLDLFDDEPDWTLDDIPRMRVRRGPLAQDHDLGDML